MSKRIKEMINKEGLKEQLEVIGKLIHKTNDNKPLQGCLQSIGYKEFIPFYEKYMEKKITSGLDE